MWKCNHIIFNFEASLITVWIIREFTTLDLNSLTFKFLFLMWKKTNDNYHQVFSRHLKVFLHILSWIQDYVFWNHEVYFAVQSILYYVFIDPKHLSICKSEVIDYFTFVGYSINNFNLLFSWINLYFLRWLRFCSDSRRIFSKCNIIFPIVAVKYDID